MPKLLLLLALPACLYAAPTASPAAQLDEAALQQRIKVLMTTRPADAQTRAANLAELEERFKEVLIRFPGGTFAKVAASSLAGLLHRTKRDEDTREFAKERVEAAKTPDEAYIAAMLMLNVAVATQDSRLPAGMLTEKGKSDPQLFGTARVRVLLGAIQVQGQLFRDANQTLEAIAPDKLEAPERNQRDMMLARADRMLAENEDPGPATELRKKALALLEGVIGRNRTPSRELLAVIPDAVDLATKLGDKAKAVALCQDMKKVFTGHPEVASSADALLFKLEAEGAPAPAFDGPDLDGKPMKLADFKGKILLLDFWFLACAPCKADHFALGQMAKKLAGKPFALISISVDPAGKADQIRAYLKQANIGWLQIYEALGFESKIAKQYHVVGCPAYFIIDENGVLKKAGLQGRPVEDAVMAEIARLEKK